MQTSKYCTMSVFNSFTGCQSAPTSNISDYYNTVGEYVKSTLPQYNTEDQNLQYLQNEINLCPEQTFNDNLQGQYRYNNIPECVPSYHVPQTGQITQNTPFLYNVPFSQQNNYNGAMTYKQVYHSKKPSLKVNMKKKRRRTIFTTEQIIALEGLFQRKPYVNREERSIMMQKLRVSEKSIKIWFQNRRRLTDKNNKDYVSDSPSSDDSSENINDRLTYIESQIQRNTDSYGYVTLDDNVMGELVNVIDEYLSQDVSWDTPPLYNHQTTVVQDEFSRNIVMYEPISPVSLSEALEDV